MAGFGRRALDYLVGEALGNLVGFGAGLGVHNLLKQFFVRKSVWNLGGALSRKQALSKDSFDALEVILTVLAGFVVFEIVRLVISRLLARKAIQVPASEPPTTTGNPNPDA